MRDGGLRSLDGIDIGRATRCWSTDIYIARNLLNPLYVISTAFKDRYGTIRDFLEEERARAGAGGYFPR